VLVKPLVHLHVNHRERITGDDVLGDPAEEPDRRDEDDDPDGQGEA